MTKNALLLLAVAIIAALAAWAIAKKVRPPEVEKDESVEGGMDKVVADAIARGIATLKDIRETEAAQRAALDPLAWISPAMMAVSIPQYSQN